jgi:hypothetical protein
VNKKSLGATIQSLQFSLSSRKNATLALSIDVAYLRISRERVKRAVSTAVDNCGFYIFGTKYVKNATLLLISAWVGMGLLYTF